MKRGCYTPHQIALLRAEILAVYNRAKSELGGNVSWSTIATWIEEAYENLTDEERNSIESSRGGKNSRAGSGSPCSRSTVAGRGGRLEV